MIIGDYHHEFGCLEIAVCAISSICNTMRIFKFKNFIIELNLREKSPNFVINQLFVALKFILHHLLAGTNMNISKWSIFNSLRAEKFNELSTCLNKPLKTCQNKEKEEINAGIGEWIVATTLSACLLWHFYVMCFFAFFSVAVKAAKEKFPNKQHQSTWWGGE